MGFGLRNSNEKRSIVYSSRELSAKVSFICAQEMPVNNLSAAFPFIDVGGTATK